MKTQFCHAQSRIRKHLKLGLSYCLSLASVLAISAEAMAQPLPGRIALPITPNEVEQNQVEQNQTAQSEISQQDSSLSDESETRSTTSEASALRLQPSYNINFTEGAGHNGFASVGGFFPIFQTPGENVTFLEGRVSVDTDGDFGGGLQAGYRTLLGDSTILGAYAGIDARDTGNGTFTQAGLGTELLGENWDLTLNANLPLGNNRQVVDSAIQAANPQFVNNQLLIDEQQVEQIEAALTTVSLDGGLELFDFGGDSSLWGRGGVYYLGGEASDDSLGFRASLDYRATNNLRFGAGVQDDGVFGTNAFFSVNASLGGRPRRAYDNTDENSTDRRTQLWARAAEPINRTNTVLIENQIDVKIVQEDVTAINPDTGNEFVFRHVDPSGGANGLANEVANGTANGDIIEAVRRTDGTFENPFSTIAQAAAASEADADNIIFVQEGNAGGGFTLPDGVQVRSVGPVQQLNTQFGTTTLPGSGSGNLPTVTGTVTVGSNSLISGLEIDPTARVAEEIARAAEVLEARQIVDGIVAHGENIALEDNVIRNVNRGIELPDINGTVSILRNQISNTVSDGIFFGDIDGTDNATVTIANNSLDALGDVGIEFDFIDDDAIANIEVVNNQITNAQDDGIFFDNITDRAIATIAISENVITGGKDGIDFDFITDEANATITVNNNQISDVIFEGINFNDIEDDAVATIAVTENQVTSTQTSIEFNEIENRANANITIVGNTITSEKRGGIFFDDIENDAVANITIAENTILEAATEGIEINRIENNANATINVLNNQISNVGEEGIFFNDIENAVTANITVSGNTITDAGKDGVEFARIENDATVTATVTNNTITNPSDDGVRINHTADSDFCLALDNNTVTNPGGDGFDLLSNGKGQFQVVDLATVTDRNVGTFNPADIEDNDAFEEGTAGEAPCF